MNKQKTYIVGISQYDMDVLRESRETHGYRIVSFPDGIRIKIVYKGDDDED